MGEHDSFADFFAGDGRYFLFGLLALLGVCLMAFLLAAVEDRLDRRRGGQAASRQDGERT